MSRNPYLSGESVTVEYLEQTSNYLKFFESVVCLLSIKLDLTTHSIAIQ